MAKGYGICVHIMYGHHVISCMATYLQAGQICFEAVRRSYGNLAMPVQSLQSLHGLMRAPYRGCMEMIMEMMW